MLYLISKLMGRPLGLCLYGARPSLAVFVQLLQRDDQIILYPSSPRQRRPSQTIFDTYASEMQ